MNVIEHMLLSQAIFESLFRPISRPFGLSHAHNFRGIFLFAKRPRFNKSKSFDVLCAQIVRSVWSGWPLAYLLDNFCDLDLVLKVKNWMKL